jgi:hypothetical protein
LGCWISPCYDQFSLGAYFETSETFIYLFNIPIFGPQQTADTATVDMGARMLFENFDY